MESEEEVDIVEEMGGETVSDDFKEESFLIHTVIKENIINDALTEEGVEENMEVNKQIYLFSIFCCFSDW